MKTLLAAFVIFAGLAIHGTLSAAPGDRPTTVSEEALTKAPTAGKIIGWNKQWGFAVANVGKKKGIKEGSGLAVRRNGKIVIIGIVEDVTADRCTIGFTNLRPKGELNNRPHLGDEVFIYPPRGGK